MNHMFSHVIVSLLTFSLLVSACAPARSLTAVAEGDADLIRHNELSAAHPELLSPAEVSERDSLWLVHQEHLAMRVGLGFDAELLVQRDSLVAKFYRQRALMSRPDSSLGSEEITEREMLVQSAADRERVLTDVYSDLQGSKLTEAGQIKIFLGIVAAGLLAYLIYVMATLAANSGGCILC